MAGAHNQTEIYYHLPVWGRWAMVGGALCIVSLTILFMVCIVSPGCLLNRLFLKDEEKEKLQKKNSKKKTTFYETQTLTGQLMNSSSASSLRALQETRNFSRSDSMLSQSTTSTVPADTFKNRKTSGTEVSSLLSSANDSTYSSMSECTSGRSSPSLIGIGMCRNNNNGEHSLPFLDGVNRKSSMTGSVKSSNSTPLHDEVQGQLKFGLQYIGNSHDPNLGKLVITVLEASELSGKEYLGTSCDAYVKVTVWRERRSLRKQKTPPLQTYRTRMIRHCRSPTYNQSFIMDVDKAQLKEIMLKLTVMDYDKYASPSTIGEVIQPIRELKNLTTLDHRTTLNYSLANPKLELGELLFGLSYLPTSQKLSVSIVKATNLKYQNIVEELTDFHPFVRLILISGSGRLLKKQKTTYRSGMNAPSWNETLTFDLTTTQMEHVTLLLVLCSRNPQVPGSSQSSYTSGESIPDLSLEYDDVSNQEMCRPPKKEKHLGKITLGYNVRGEDARKHWQSVLFNPRKVESHWHFIK